MTLYEKWEKADDEVFHLSEAIDQLKQVRGSDDVIEVLKPVFNFKASDEEVPWKKTTKEAGSESSGNT